MGALDQDTEILGPRRAFRTTHWTQVRAAHDPAQLDTLIAIYWKPLYFFVRRRGWDNETSKDLVQGFLTQMLDHDGFIRADPARGRFRTYLLAALTNFLKDHAKAASRAKRGGHAKILSLDFTRGEQEYVQIAADSEPPEKTLDRAWARSLLRESMTELRGAALHLEAFRRYAEGADYAAICAATGLSESAAKTAIHRLRGQLRGIVIGHLRITAADKYQADADIADFLAYIS